MAVLCVLGAGHRCMHCRDGHVGGGGRGGMLGRCKSMYGLPSPPPTDFSLCGVVCAQGFSTAQKLDKLGMR